VPKKSAGLLLYRKVDRSMEVFLVHPGGPFWAKKDDGAWSIPKGEIGDGEEALEAAKREFREETGFELQGRFEAMEPVKQTSGKIVYAWSIEGHVEASALSSNHFSIEWPPRSGNMKEFPEVDRGAWFAIEAAQKKIVKGQAPLLKRLEERLRREGQLGEQSRA
jgi:predicted NUDIX family NTP pyrophosphohydrolase